MEPTTAKGDEYQQKAMDIAFLWSDLQAIYDIAHDADGTRTCSSFALLNLKQLFRLLVVAATLEFTRSYMKYQ